MLYVYFIELQVIPTRTTIFLFKYDGIDINNQLFINRALASSHLKEKKL